MEKTREIFVLRTKSAALCADNFGKAFNNSVYGVYAPAVEDVPAEVLFGTVKTKTQTCEALVVIADKGEDISCYSFALAQAAANGVPVFTYFAGCDIEKEAEKLKEALSVLKGETVIEPLTVMPDTPVSKGSVTTDKMPEKDPASSSCAIKLDGDAEKGVPAEPVNPDDVPTVNPGAQPAESPEEKGKKLYKEAKRYARGDGVEKDHNKAIALYTEAAKLNNADALYELGKYTSAGKRVPKDPEKAYYYFTKAASLGCVDAVNAIGNCYINGEAVEKSPEKAFKCYKKASELGCIAAYNNLGSCYFSGVGTTPDSAEGLRCYLHAAEANDSYALYTAGYCYLNGIGAARDKEKGLEFCRKAQALGNKEAAALLAKFQ